MTMDSDRRARLAKDILANEVLDEAFATVRRNAMEALLGTDASNTSEINRLQSIGNCIEEVVLLLQAAIISHGDRDGGFDANAPTEH